MFVAARLSSTGNSVVNFSRYEAVRHTDAPAQVNCVDTEAS